MSANDPSTFPELMGAREAAEVLGVKRPNLRTLVGIPEPVQELASGPVWLASDIREFAQERERRKHDNGS